MDCWAFGRSNIYFWIDQIPLISAKLGQQKLGGLKYIFTFITFIEAVGLDHMAAIQN